MKFLNYFQSFFRLFRLFYVLQYLFLHLFLEILPNNIIKDHYRIITLYAFIKNRMKLNNLKLFFRFLRLLLPLKFQEYLHSHLLIIEFSQYILFQFLNRGIFINFLRIIDHFHLHLFIKPRLSPKKLRIAKTIILSFILLYFKNILESLS